MGERQQTEVHGSFRVDSQRGDYAQTPGERRAAADAYRPGRDGQQPGQFARDARARIDQQNAELIRKGIVPPLTIDGVNAARQPDSAAPQHAGDAAKSAVKTDGASTGEGKTGGAEVNQTTATDGRNSAAAPAKPAVANDTSKAGDNVTNQIGSEKPSPAPKPGTHDHWHNRPAPVAPASVAPAPTPLA